MPAAKGSARTSLGPIVATFVYASSQGQRTHSARTNKLAKLSLSLFPLSLFLKFGAMIDTNRPGSGFGFYLDQDWQYNNVQKIW